MSSDEKAPIDFYFDFSSPYGYLASEKIDALAARFGRRVRWHPVLLGVIFKETGVLPLTQQKIKGPYYVHDFARSARFMGVPYRHPEKFPLPTQAAARAYYWLHGQDCAKAREFAHAVFRALFVNNSDVSTPDTVLELAAGLGVDRVALSAAIASEEMKVRLKSEIETAQARGVFGSPTVIVDGELFFGADRLPQIEKWLAEGGF
jgi:2-hydroxychromene-2-carboxylate isomerase